MHKVDNLAIMDFVAKIAFSAVQSALQKLVLFLLIVAPPAISAPADDTIDFVIAGDKISIPARLTRSVQRTGMDVTLIILNLIYSIGNGFQAADSHSDDDVSINIEVLPENYTATSYKKRVLEGAQPLGPNPALPGFEVFDLKYGSELFQDVYNEKLFFICDPLPPFLRTASRTYQGCRYATEIGRHSFFKAYFKEMHFNHIRKLQIALIDLGNELYRMK